MSSRLRYLKIHLEIEDREVITVAVRYQHDAAYTLKNHDKVETVLLGILVSVLHFGTND